jgi:CRISPR-associated protein Csy1
MEEAAAHRLNERLKKITEKNSQSEIRRQKLKEDLKLDSLLDYGVANSSQIQLATHILKGIHPDTKVKETTNLLIKPSSLSSGLFIGSHILSDDIAPDTTGNGSHNTRIYELSLVLHSKIEGKTIIDLLKSNDPDAISAIELGATINNPRLFSLSTIDTSRCLNQSTDNKAKQIYWLVEKNAHDNNGFHLLAPLYPTVLAHKVQERISEDRFSDSAKDARKSRKDGIYHSLPVREYSGLAIQKLGGTKPQNISHLNSARLGNSFLLSSVPPTWHSLDVRPLLGIKNLFSVFGRQRNVRRNLQALKQFLETQPQANMVTRKKVTALVNELIDELLNFTSLYHLLPHNWSISPDCDLPISQRKWLDPDLNQSVRIEFDEIYEDIANDFARWLNLLLRDPLPVGDPEFLQWKKLAIEQFKTFLPQGAQS